MKHKLQKLVWAAACTLCAAAGRAEGLPADWPALPLLSIETEGGEFPTCSVVMPPEGCVGTGITDAEYVKGHLVMTLCGDTLLDNYDLCRLLGVTKRTLARYRQKKLIRYYMIDGRTYYKASEIQEFLQMKGKSLPAAVSH